MRAAVARSYGPPDSIAVATVADPAPGPGELLVRVHAAGINPLDTYITTGRPVLLRLVFGLRRPKRAIVGAEFAGVVEAVGEDVTEPAVGDAVWGHHNGACAELVVAGVDHVVPKPERVTFAQAGGVDVAATTALQALRDHAGVSRGDRVLVVGASGGVGTFAVQIAKHLGADVTGVCSTRNVELIERLGADRVVDYTVDDWCDPSTNGRYDVVVDNVGDRPLAACRRVLVDDGTYVMVGSPKGGAILGPLRRLVPFMIQSRFSSDRLKSFTAKNGPEDLRVINEMLVEGAVTPVVDRTYRLEDTADAMAHLATGRARGKIVVIVTPEAADDRESA